MSKNIFNASVTPNISKEDLTSVYSILYSIEKIISKDIDKNSLSDFNRMFIEKIDLDIKRIYNIILD